MPSRIAGALIRATRPPFLLLTPACLLAGVGHAAGQGAAVAWQTLLPVLGAALAAHVSVNALNEYADCRSGLDARTDRTPFSGGSGALIAVPEAARPVLLLGVATLAFAVLAGLWLAARIDWGLLPLGALGVVIIAAYTPWLNRSPWLCLIAPGLAFGPLMVIGSDWVLRGQFSASAVPVSLVPFFLVNNLLLLNQYPDVDADRSVGRHHLPIRHGLAVSSAVHGLFVLATALVIAFGLGSAGWPGTASLALLPVAAGALASYGAMRHGRDIDRLLPFMTLNVVAALATPALLGVALWFG